MESFEGSRLAFFTERSIEVENTQRGARAHAAWMTRCFSEWIWLHVAGLCVRSNSRRALRLGEKLVFDGCIGRSVVELRGSRGGCDAFFAQ